VSNQSRFGVALALSAVAVGVFADGGYSAAARVAFGVVALLSFRRVAREPIFVVLAALAALGAMSALWTIGPVDRTLRWALVCAGYAALFAAAATIARRRGGVKLLAGAIGVLAFGAGLAGLVATLLELRPYALPIGGHWRPAGPFEYPPALALLEVSALPVFMAARSRLPALAVAVAVIGLSGSRVALALAVVVVGLHLVRRWRAPAIAAVLVVAVLAGIFAFGAAAGRDAYGPASSFLHGRENTWQAAIETFADRPIQGTGADAFLAGSARHQDGETVVFAHNLPLELAAELGIAGAALALALYAATARTLWRARHTEAARLLGPAAAAFLIASLVDWPWHLAGSGAVWAMAAGALTAAAKVSSPQSKETL
jgi:hypothetical protein